MPDIWIRTDGNDNIATGHLMRCLSIARACADLGKRVCFLVADAQSEALLRERFTSPSEFDIKCLHSDYQDMEKELPDLERIIQVGHASSNRISPKGTSRILVDSYYVTASYLEALKQWGQVVYLDDLIAFPYPADCIINYDMPENEKPDCYSMAARCLMGSAYAPLRAQFRNVPYTVQTEAKDILLSTGGTDPYHVAMTILDCLVIKNRASSIARSAPQTRYSIQEHPSVSGVTEYQYHIVTGRLNPCYDRLTELCGKYPNIHIHENVQDMAGLMAQCDLAVSAGGTTLYELCAVGVPTISFAMADNQLSAVQAFSASDIIPYAGDVRVDIGGALDSIRRFLDEKGSSYAMRLDSSNKMRSFVDGYGAVRIAEALFATSGTSTAAYSMP